jgi:hypothetical protein
MLLTRIIRSQITVGKYRGERVLHIHHACRQPINKRHAFKNQIKLNQNIIQKKNTSSYKHESLYHKAFHSANIIFVTGLYYLWCILFSSNKCRFEDHKPVGFGPGPRHPLQIERWRPWRARSPFWWLLHTEFLFQCLGNYTILLRHDMVR